MANENKYDYYRIKVEYAKPLFDEYSALREIMRKDLKKTIKEFKAAGVVQSSALGRTRISNFYFSNDCKFDFKFSSKEIDGGFIVKPHRNSKSGKAFYEKMNSEIKRLDETYKGKIVIGDWLIDKFNCYREIFIGYTFLSSWAGADSNKELIMFRIPKTDKPFNPPNEFELITYGSFYDLANG